MSVRTSPRVSAGNAALIAAGLVLGACGSGGDEAATRPTLTLAVGETNFATLPPATTAPTAEEGDEEVDADASGVQEYQVQAGDYGIKVANDFGVTLEDLENINGWSDAGREFPNPGNTIKIPAGATAPGESSDTDSGSSESADGSDDAGSDTGDADDAGESGETGEAIPEPGGNCEAGSHTVASGDIPLKLVDLYDVTLDALDAANADNPAYGSFIPGQKIIIPAKDDC